jgi:hypothetical protein
MDLIAALFAIGTAYMTYFSSLLIKRLRAKPKNRLLGHLLVRWYIAMTCYAVATLLLLLAAILSSTAFLVGGVFILAISGVSSIIFTVVRPRH